MRDHRRGARLRCAFAVLVVVGCVSGCSGSGANAGVNGSPATAITDMLGRNVLIPNHVHRILALHPIPTTLLELLAPDRIVSVDAVFARSLQRDDARFTPAQMSSLTSLPHTGVYFRGFDPEQVIKLHPDVVLTMTGDTNIDREQRQTGIPFVAVSKMPTASYETTIRLIGRIVGRAVRADQMAEFWAQHVTAVTARTAAVPVRERPTVVYTGKNGDILDIPGKDTVFGSTIATAGGRYLGDRLSAGHADTESNPVSIEQIIVWDPEVIVVPSADARSRIGRDPRWQPVSAVRTGRVYVSPRYEGLDGLQAVLGMVWTQGILLDHDDAHARATLSAATQDYYALFYGHPLPPAQITEVAR